MDQDPTRSHDCVVGPRIRDVIPKLIGLAQDRTLLALSMLFVVALAGLLWQQSRQRLRLVESTALQHAAQYSEVIAEFRTLNTSEVVQSVKGHGTQVTRDYEGKEAAIPLPATLSMRLGNRLAERNSGGRTGPVSYTHLTLPTTPYV